MSTSLSQRRRMHEAATTKSTKSRWRPTGNENLRHVEPRQDEHNEKAASATGMKETVETSQGLPVEIYEAPSRARLSI